MPTTLITDLGETKLAQASGSGSQVVITEIALGDGNGAVYAPWFGMTALRREQARRAIDSRIFLSSNSWRVRAEFPPDTPSFFVREIGWFDEDGDLIAVTAGTDMTARQTGGLAYLAELVLDFSQVTDGLVIVNAPDDELVEFALASIAHQATNSLTLFHLNEAFHDAHGTYPGA